MFPLRLSQSEEKEPQPDQPKILFSHVEPEVKKELNQLMQVCGILYMCSRYSVPGPELSTWYSVPVPAYQIL